MNSGCELLHLRGQKGLSLKIGYQKNDDYLKSTNSSSFVRQKTRIIYVYIYMYIYIYIVNIAHAVVMFSHLPS